MQTCSHCGYESPDGATFCERCGTLFIEELPEPAVKKHTMIESVQLAFKNFGNFEGRTSRRDYWFFSIFNVIMTAVLAVLFTTIVGLGYYRHESDALLLALVVVGIMTFCIYFLVLIIPSWSIMVRRLHDIGKSGWLLFWNLLPYLGLMILLVYCCFDSQPGENEYGPNPKELQ